MSLVIGFANARFAVAQDKPNLRVVVSVSGREILDGLLSAVADRTGLAGLLAVSHAQALDALRSFCRNEPATSPDVVLATHHMESALAGECAKNGLAVVAIELARDPLILAVRSGAALTRLTSRQVYLAIAREVPFHDEFVRNTSVRWSDVDSALPPQDIRFELPMRDEGSRATFNELVLESGCRDEGPVKEIFEARKRTLQCITTRSDRVRELPRAQAMKTLLEAPVGTIGVLSQSELAQSNGQFVALTLDGMAPSPAALRNGAYDFSTSFWLYAKNTNGATDPTSLAINNVVAQAQSDAIIGPNGPLAQLGVVPLPDEERAAQRSALAEAGQPYGLGSVVEWLQSTVVAGWDMFVARRSATALEGNEAPMDFAALMDVAGYQVESVKSSIGIIPEASMTFGLAREMSDADHQYLQRVLRRDAQARPSLLSAIQRRIIRSIMDVQEVGGFQVSKVEVDFLPLPNVSLEVTPKDAGGGHQSDNSNSASSD